MLSLAFPFLLLLCHLLVSAFFAFFSLCLRYNATDSFTSTQPHMPFSFTFITPTSLASLLLFFPFKEKTKSSTLRACFRARAL